jgi:hypothetical protein
MAWVKLVPAILLRWVRCVPRDARHRAGHGAEFRAAQGKSYAAVLMTASSYLPEPMPVSAKMPWSAIHLKVSS